MAMAFEKLYPNVKIRVNYQLSNSMYCTLDDGEASNEMIKNVEDEINEAKLKYNFNCTLVQSETDENGRIIIVDNVIELLRK